MLHQYRVTKYNPDFRDSSGAYKREDWTSHSDIGTFFSGEKLTEKCYLEVESAYLEAATSFLSEAEIYSLSVVGIENRRADLDAPREGSVIQLEHVKTVLCALLRENYWCKLESDHAFIHVGYEYYMYSSVPCVCTQAKQHTIRMGLFVESFPSPHLRDAL
jgi:hypothetical protein